MNIVFLPTLTQSCSGYSWSCKNHVVNMSRVYLVCCFFFSWGFIGYHWMFSGSKNDTTILVWHFSVSGFLSSFYRQRKRGTERGHKADQGWNCEEQLVFFLNLCPRSITLVLFPLLKAMGTSVAGRVKTSCSIYILEDNVLFYRVHVAPFFPSVYLYFLGTSCILDRLTKKMKQTYTRQILHKLQRAVPSNVQIPL